MITYVSSFFYGKHPKRSTEEYKRYFDSIASSGASILLFLDKESTWTFPPNVRVERLSLEETWVGTHIPDTDCLPTTRSPNDTCEYMKIMNSKTECLFKASQLNPFQTEWFAWIDFGLAHVFTNPVDTIRRLTTLIPPCYPCIRTAGIWKDSNKTTDLIDWRFAGGFMLAHGSKLESLHTKVCDTLLSLQPKFTWEVNVWAMLENDGLDLGWFPSDHDDSIIPVTSFPIETLSTAAEFTEPEGRQHYRLLARLSSQFYGKTLIDIGTHRGMSALALSYNTFNTVLSFDIEEKDGRPVRPNIHYKSDDVLMGSGRELWKETLLASPLIFLDIDPHEGTREYEFYLWLRDNDYKGSLICDDIWYFKEMRDNFWYKIPSKHTLDISSQGHWSGTGLVRFDLPKKPESNWTVVTGYFDLTKMPDASPSIKSRPFEHYLESARTTLAVNQNLVVFCEPKHVQAIMSLRPPHLREKTRCMVMSFEEFPLTQYRERIAENRTRIPSMDDRNTPSYYLFCMARYAMLKQVIQSNPFQSTHFAWLNLCIERMGWKNLTQLNRVFELNRDKFSTCYIDYQPRESYLENTMAQGRCSMCSGFFTGNAYYMKEFCDRIEDKFVDCLEKGYGHADEQLFSLVYFDKPSLFDVYYGDYTEMITNYEWVLEHPRKPLYLLIKHSYEAGDRSTCLTACRALWRSFKKGYAKLSETETIHLIWYYQNSLHLLGLPVELE